MKTSSLRRVLPASCSLLISMLLTAMPPASCTEEKIANDLRAAILMYNGNQHKEALSQIETVLKSTPNDVIARYYKGLCLQNLNQYDTANKEFDWVIKNSKLPTYTRLAERARQQISNVKTVITTPTTPKNTGQNPKVYDFYTTWCGPCKVLKPTFDSVEEEYKGKVDMVSLDAEDPANRKLVEKYQIFGYPTLIFLDAAGKKVDEAVGVLPKIELQRRVRKLLAL